MTEKGSERPELPKNYQPRLKIHYRQAVVPELKKRFGYSHDLQVPRLEKITVNIGIGEAREDVRVLDIAAQELAAITGQKPQIRRARKSISAFGLRAGQPVGLRVTLRGDRMYEFLDRFLSCAVPRLRDFRGFSRAHFDGRGGYTLGLREQYIFFEVNPDRSDKARGMNISFTTTARNAQETEALLSQMGFPFERKRETPQKKEAADGEKVLAVP